jgi:uncharacterized cupin superfamily protein
MADRRRSRRPVDRAAHVIYDLEPGQGSSPYHYEYDEEWLLVVEGRSSCARRTGSTTLERGELVASRPVRKERTRS